MKRKTRALSLVVLAWMLASLSILSAQEKHALPAYERQRISVGYGLARAQDEFSLNANLTSPWVLGNHAAIRLWALGLFHTGSWQPYYGFRFGLIGGSLMETAAIRLYGEGGVLMVIPSSSFDSDTTIWGGYGLFGFEFFAYRPGHGLAFYIELGSNGVDARAEKEAGSPMYLNGFETSAGLRYYF